MIERGAFVLGKGAATSLAAPILSAIPVAISDEGVNSRVKYEEVGTVGIITGETVGVTLFRTTAFGFELGVGDRLSTLGIKMRLTALTQGTVFRGFGFGEAKALEALAGEFDDFLKMTFGLTGSPEAVEYGDEHQRFEQ